MPGDAKMTGKDLSIVQLRLRVVLLLVLIVPLGFATKFYPGAGHQWVNNHFGGFLYEIFWILVLFFIFPGSRARSIAAIVFFTTCALEFLQLWHPPFLEWARSFFIGRTILGSFFTWYDFPWYLLGSLSGYLILKFRFFRRG